MACAAQVYQGCHPRADPDGRGGAAMNTACPVRFGMQHTVHTVQRPVVVGVCARAVCRVHRPDSAQLPIGPTSRDTGERGPRGGKWWRTLANRYFQRHTSTVTAAEAVAVLGTVCFRVRNTPNRRCRAKNADSGPDLLAPNGRQRARRGNDATFVRVAALSARATAGTPRPPGRDTGQRGRRGATLAQERR